MLSSFLFAFAFASLMDDGAFVSDESLLPPLEEDFLLLGTEEEAAA